MGGLVSSFGLGEGGGETGSSGVKFAAGAAPLINPFTDVGQLKTAYDQSQYGIAQQQNFLNALQAQNGIQNQSNIYNQLSGIAAGAGPNPAQAMLANSTGNNIASQAALMAGQRGAGANTGLIARQAAQQGGALQQQAVGQGAALQAQQSLNALNMQGGLATNMVGQQAAATQGYNQAAQSEQQNLLNAANALNQNNITMRSNQNNVNGGLANTVANGQQQMAGNLMGGIGAAVGMAHGGQVPKFADGGMPSAEDWYQYATQSPGQMPTSDQNASMYGATDAVDSEDAPKSNVGKFHLFGSAPSQSSAASSNPFQSTPNQTGAQALGTGAQAAGQGIGSLISKAGPLLLAAAHGGKVPAMVSPGEAYIPPHNVKAVANGSSDIDEASEKIPGKAKVKGDSLKNDTVSKTLDAGGVVIPRSIMESDDAAKKAAKFVQAILNKKSKSLPKR